MSVQVLCTQWLSASLHLCHLLYLVFQGAHFLIYALQEVVNLQKRSSLKLPTVATFPVGEHAENTPCEVGYLSSATHLLVYDLPLPPVFSTEKLLYFWPIVSLLGPEQVGSQMVCTNGTIDCIVTLACPRVMAQSLSQSTGFWYSEGGRRLRLSEARRGTCLYFHHWA